ncbi:MAG: hypothetical protein KC636_09565, partial [Myxococcales bacterium]|nr:hypothetical protein [Myxococcales bacterium]
MLATLRDEPTSTEPPPRRRLLELPRAEPPRRRWPRLRALARRARASEALRDPSSPLRRAAFVIASIGGVVGAHGLGAALGDAFARDLPEPVVEQPSPPRAAPVDASTLERARSLLAHEPVDAAFLAAGLLT